MNRQKIAVAVMTVLSLSSFQSSKNTEVCPYGAAPRQTGVRMVDALRASSAEAYLQEFPALNELLVAMDKNKGLYGAYYQAARQDLAEQYVTEIVPAAHENFNRLLRQGVARGIVWSEVEFVRWEISTKEQTRWDEIPFVLVVQFREREYRIAVRGLVLQSQLRLSQHMVLL